MKMGRIRESLRSRTAMACAVALGAALALGGCETVTTTADGVQINKAPVPGATEGNARQRALARLQLATGYYRDGQIPVALQDVRRSIAVDPDLAAAHGLYGLILMNLGQIDTADEEFQRALALDPKSPDLQNNYGWFLCRTGRAKDSVAWFDKAAANPLYQTPARALQDAGICLLQIHDNARAEQYFLRALRYDATDPIAKFQLSQMYLKAGRLGRAQFYYDLLVRSVPPNPETLWLGARLARAQHDPTTEHHDEDELLGKFPNSPQADALHHGRFDE